MYFCQFIFATIMIVSLITHGCKSSTKAPDSNFYKKQLELDPTNGQLAISFEVEGEYEKAIKQFESTFQICPKTSHLSLQLGVSYILSNKLELGFIEMEHAITIAEKNDDVELKNAIKSEVQLWKDYINKNR